MRRVRIRGLVQGYGRYSFEKVRLNMGKSEVDRRVARAFERM